jgi:adenylate kinase
LRALQLRADPDELRERLMGRATIEGRVDDTPETIAHRMQVYEAQTFPLVEYYRRRDQLEVIDAMGTPDEVFARIKGVMSDE